MTHEQVGEALQTWLDEFAAHVRAGDYDGARPMIAEDIVSFGTKANMVEGRESLITNQWKHIWPTISGFTFDFDTLHWQTAGDIAWCVVTWHSLGTRPDGAHFPRPGRATFAFVRRDGCWLASHSHLSLFPTPVE